MNITALTTSLPNAFAESIGILADAGFEWIDVPPIAAQPEYRQQMSDRGLRIGSVGLEKEPPREFDLASESQNERDAAINYFRSTLDATAELGVGLGYITPPLSNDDATRQRWNESIARLAEHAAKCSVDLCIEHFPTRLLHSGADTLDWLAEMQQPALKLLIDVGHCLISKEDPAELIRAAGPQLGYIHFDDNDGEDDLHWGLFNGVCTEAVLRSTIAALVECRYERCLCLEFNPGLDEPLRTLTDGKQILARCSTP